MNKGDNKLTNEPLPKKEHKWNLTKLHQFCIEEKIKSM